MTNTPNPSLASVFPTLQTPPPARITSNIPALDEILGGGITQGSVISISSETRPQLATMLAKQIGLNQKTTYLTSPTTISHDQFLQLLQDIRLHAADSDMIIMDGIEEANLSPQPTPQVVLAHYFTSLLPDLAEHCRKANCTLLLVSKIPFLITRYQSSLILTVDVSDDRNYVHVATYKNLDGPNHGTVDLPLSALETLS